MPKEFFFRGKNLEELKSLDIREFANLLDSKGKRNLLRQSDNVGIFLKRCEKKKAKAKKIRVHNRNLIIVPAMVNLTIFVYNGKEFVMLKILPELIGHKLGEFVPTRKKIAHSSPGVSE